MLQSLQSHLLDGNYRKRSPDPLKGTQAECQDITANQHPTTVPIVPYRMATKYQHVAASECEWHAQLATDTAVSQKWLKYCSLFRMPAAKRILAVRTLLPSVHLVDIDITHVIFYQAPVFAYYKWLGDFRSNVTSGSLPVTWGHVTPFPVTWLSSPASYSFVGS